MNGNIGTDGPDMSIRRLAYLLMRLNIGSGYVHFKKWDNATAMFEYIGRMGILGEE